MRELLLQLIRLQELIFAQWEHEAADSRIGLREIQDAIEGLVAGLPKAWARTILRLQGDGQPAVVPATNGVCSFCRIQLPTSLIQDIQRMTKLHQCPCCARILFLPEGGGLHAGVGRSELGRGGIARFSSQRLMVPRLRADGRDEALEELVQTMARQGWIDAPGEMLQAAIAREEIVTSALEHGLAFPHVRGVEGGGLVVSLGLKKRGLRFGAPAGRLTRLIFFSVIPQAASGYYLCLMAGLARAFRRESSRKRLLACDSPEETWEILNQETEGTIP